ncbi:MAG TPA: tellurite resistance TerB family protein [Rhodocyclaceae bacterium]|nr:tellurite resistance TerB family protein [Zoogloeaceae bacterium]HRD32972.1 tellurite resistance TerB family protein [Rhodocyclaceae bacterium]
MSFANIVGALLQQGMAGQSRSRLERTVGPQGLGGAGGGGIEQMLGSLLGGLGGGAPSGGAGGGAGAGLGSLIGLAETFLGSKQAGNLTGGQLGGLGAIAGALLGGGGKSVKGALGGSAMAILGALAVNALQGRLAGAAATPAQAQEIAAEQLQALADPATERLIVRAMISAAKADGQVDEQEMERIAGKIGTDGITPEERQLVLEELRRPLDLGALVADVQNPVVAAEVYGASLLAINVDTEAEVAYLNQLARALGLDAATVARLHELTGAPATIR